MTELENFNDILNSEMASEVTKDFFCSYLLKLSSDYEIVNTQNSSFANLEYEKQKSFFSSDFVDIVEEVYLKLETLSLASTELAKHLYKLLIITNATLEELSKIISYAYNKKISKSYLSKLTNSGRLLIELPQLESVSDIEKLSQLASLPTKVLSSQITGSSQKTFISDLDIVESSRGNLKAKIDEIKISQNIPTRRSTPRAIPVVQTKTEEVEVSAVVEEVHSDIVKDLELILIQIQTIPLAYQKLQECIIKLKVH